MGDVYLCHYLWGTDCSRDYAVRAWGKVEAHRDRNHSIFLASIRNTLETANLEPSDLSIYVGGTACSGNRLLDSNMHIGGDEERCMVTGRISSTRVR